MKTTPFVNPNLAARTVVNRAASNPNQLNNLLPQINNADRKVIRE